MEGKDKEKGSWFIGDGFWFLELQFHYQSLTITY